MEIVDDNDDNTIRQSLSGSQGTFRKYINLKFEIKTKVDSYMPCKAMAHSTK